MLFFISVLLALLGGADVGVATRQAMAHIMSNQLADKFNWCGRGSKGKTAFEKLKLKEVVASKYPVNNCPQSAI